MNYEINIKIQYFSSEHQPVIWKDKNEKPFTESLIPKEYQHYTYNTVDLQTYSKFRKEFIRLKDSYQEELEGLTPEGERVIYEENDWESELCYTQGKFLEHVSWKGEAPPYYEPNEFYITANVTFRKLSPGELAYYLYWRTEFKKGNYVKGYRACYYLFLYELVVNLGGFDTETTFKYMEVLKTNCIPRMQIKSKINRIKVELAKYRSSQNIQLFQRPRSKWQEEWEIIPYEIANKKYTHAFEFMDRIANYRLSSSEFVKETKCKKDIAVCITKSLPILENLFKENELILSDFLSGIIEKESVKDSPLVKDTIWTEYTISRLLLQNSSIKPHRKKCKIEVVLLGSGLRHEVHKQIISFDYDVNLTNYIFQCCESEFRKYSKFPELKIEDPVAYKYTSIEGDFYAVPVDLELRRRWTKYYSLYPKLRKVLKSVVKSFLKNNLQFKSLPD